MSNGFIVTGADNPLQPSQFDPEFGVSSPRFVVTINSKPYVPISVEVNGNAHGATGDATITLAVQGNPDFSLELARGDIPAGGGFTIEDDSPVYVEIFVGFPSQLSVGSTDTSQMQRAFFGIVDQDSAAFALGEVTFTCRSLAAPLVDNDITRLTLNETSLQFAKSAADSVGLKFVPNIAGEPMTIQEVLAAEFIGGANFSAAIHRLKYWDLLLQCALFDDADVWVEGDTLFYASPSLIERKTVEVKYGRDVLLDDGLTGTHSPQFSKNVQVVVHTYQRKTRTVTSSSTRTNPNGGTTSKTVTRKVTSSPVFGTPGVISTSTGSDGSTSVSSSVSSGGAFSGTAKPGHESGKERYNIYVRNISPARANQLAQSLWRKISQHEYSIDVGMAVRKETLSQLLSMSVLLKVSGAPYAKFNDTYFPRRMTLRGSAADGATWHFSAVNHLLPQGAV